MVSKSFLLDLTIRENDEILSSEYPFTIPAIRSLKQLALHPKVTYFVGENGSGKSTLLEAIAIAIGLNPEGGTKNFTFSTRASHSGLHEWLRIARGARRPRTSYFFRAESYFNLATNIDQLDNDPSLRNPVLRPTPRVIDSYGGVSLHEQSHGESFSALFSNRFSDDGLYLLDEPEAALSPSRQLAFLARMHQLIRGKSQFIIATHSPILLGYPDAKILQFSNEGLTEIDYESSAPVSLTRSFVLRREQILADILGEEVGEDS